ncbi:hypothetical protein R6Q59_013016 [Mikania micrantha]
MTNHHNNHNKIIHHHHHKTNNNHHHHHLLPPSLCHQNHRPPSKPAPPAATNAGSAHRTAFLAPYFPHDRQRQFQNAHKLFGVSNITKIIRNLDRPQKDEAMRTIIYQSDVRSIDPVGGCYRIIRELQRQIEISCAELEFVLQQLALYRTLNMQNNNQNHQQFNHDLIIIDEIDYDIHISNNQDEPQLYDDRSENHHHHHHDQYDSGKHDSGWVDNQVAPVQSWSVVHDSTQPLHASVSSSCDDFKSLLINEINPPGERVDEFKFKDRNEPSERSLFDEENQKAGLIKVENVCYNEEQFEIEMKNNTFGALTDHKAIHVEGDYSP